MSDIEKLKTYTDEQIKEMDKEKLIEECKKIQDIAKDGNEVILGLI